MGIEGGSSNNEVQSQEINQANNEQIEQNQAEHERSGQELEGNSTIDNEGERKQIEGKDDATEVADDGKSDLDAQDSIEDDPNQENAEPAENNQPEQQLENQDNIENDTSDSQDAADTDEVEDALDGQDSIEDDSDNLQEDSSETDSEDGLDSDDSIEDDSEDTSSEASPESHFDDDSIEDESEDETPEDESDAEKPENDSEDETPEDESDTEKPEEDSEDETPEDESDTEKPEEDSEDETPEDESDTEKPEEDSEDETSKDEFDGEKPEEDSEDEASEDESDAEKPENDSEDETAEDESDAEKPENDSEDEIAEDESDAEKPEDDSEGEATEDESDAEKPENDSESEIPKDESDSENPEEKSEGEKLDDKKPENMASEYYSKCNEIGKNPDLSPSEKVKEMQGVFNDLGDGNREDLQCVASEKYLDDKEPFRDDGRANVDYPDHQGFNMEEGKEPKPISRENPMQESVDRYGSPNGNFVAGMENGEPASFESRALPNVENPESYHSYDIDNPRYCDAVDMVRNCDPDNMQPTIDNINDMINDINKEQGLDLDPIDSDDMKDMIAHYGDYQKNLANDIPEISAEDAPYGLSGEAAPWDSSDGERLSDGGADQKWLPLTVDDFEKMGIFKER